MENLERQFKGIWIPREIWLSKDLTLQEKVLLVEIDSLDNENGCTATNQYFADFFGISKTRISILINNLIKKGYIISNIVYKEGTKEILYRVLNICYIPYITKVKGGIQEKLNTPIQEKLKDNNIYNNNIYNNIYNNKKEIYKEKSFEKFYEAYPRKVGKANVEKWFDKNKPDDDLLKTMLDKLELYKKTKQWQDKQFIPHPTTWLNQKRWEDEVAVEEEKDTAKNNLSEVVIDEEEKQKQEMMMRIARTMYTDEEMGLK